MFGWAFNPFQSAPLASSPASPPPTSSFVCIGVTDVVIVEPSWATMMIYSTLTELK